MNDTTIHLALVDDWELSGSGSGDPEDLQFRPMRKLAKIYNSYGIRASFNAEVMQQLAFRDFETQHPHLKSLADEWDETIRETFRQGHDIQLHTHPQWTSSEYQEGKWVLKGDWSIVNYSLDEARQMLVRGKEYLENLLRPLDSNYRCISYRAGSWCIAPSLFMLNLLADLGIVFDISVIGKLKYDTRRVKLDYSNCEEDFVPFYPVMTDARRVSDKVERIICVPTNHFYGSRRLTLKHHVAKAAARLNRVQSVGPAATSVQTSGSYGSDWADTKHESSLRRIYEKGVVPYIKGKHLISDLAQLDYALMREMLSSIRRRARATGLANIPVVLGIHTKDIRVFDDIERFVSDISAAPDIKCVTLTEVAQGLQKGTFPIKTKS
jgi:hypothetical protein